MGMGWTNCTGLACFQLYLMLFDEGGSGTISEVGDIVEAKVLTYQFRRELSEDDEYD